MVLKRETLNELFSINGMSLNKSVFCLREYRSDSDILNLPISIINLERRIRNECPHFSSRAIKGHIHFNIMSNTDHNKYQTAMHSNSIHRHITLLYVHMVLI